MSEDVVSDSKLMVLFTDGETNSDSSIVPMSDIIRKALDNNINIVTVINVAPWLCMVKR